MLQSRFSSVVENNAGIPAARVTRLLQEALRLLHIFTSGFEKIPESSVTEMICAITACYQCVRLNVTNLTMKEPLTVEKYLYHLVNKMVKKVCFLLKCLTTGMVRV